MSRNPHASTHERRQAQKPQRTPTSGAPVTDSATAELTATPHDAAAHLADGRIPVAQRQAVAAHIGQVAGNRQLQRTMADGAPPQVQRDWMEDAVDWAADTAEGALDMAGNAADWVEDTAEETLDMAGGAVDWAGDTAEGALDMAGDAVDWAGDQAGNAADWAGEQAEDAADWVADKAGDVLDWAGERVDEVVDGVGQGADWVQDRASDVVDWVKEAVEDAIDWVGDKGSEAIEGGRELLKGIGETAERMAYEAEKALQGEGGGPLTDADKKRFEEIEAILETIPTGRQALLIMYKYKIGVAFQGGNGSYFDPVTENMVIDSAESAEDAALTFVHEINHGRYHFEGLEGDATKLSRDEYIKSRVEEEAEGAVKSIEAKIELEGTPIDVSQASFPQEAEYRQAYNDAIAAATAKDPGLSKAELNEIGRKAGKERVIWGFMNGEVVTSTKPPQTYPVFYGEDWDNQNGFP